jgi:hypothetical protein
MQYVPPYGINDPNAPYINGDPSIGRAGSIPPAAAFEYPMRELQNFITDTGQTPSNGDLHQISRGVQNGMVQFGVDTGTKNALVVALNPPPLSLVVGMTVRCKKIGVANDGPSTLNIGLGANTIKRANGSDVGAGDLPASTMAAMVWDGANWQLQNFQAATTSNTINNFNTINLPYAIDTGTTNAVIAAFSPAITAVAGGDMFKVKLANSITGAATIKINALAALPLVRPDSSPCQGGEGSIGMEMILIFDGTNIQFANASYAASSQLACSSLNLVGGAPGGAKTASWTADELVGKSALGGVSYTGANLTLNFNGNTNGPGGMDTGGTPPNGDLHIYAIYAPTTGVWTTFGTTAYRTALYGGSLPAGYKASALIWSGKTDSNGNIVYFRQKQKRIIIDNTMIFNIGSSGAVNLTAQSFGVCVPYNAKSVTGWMFAGSWGGGTQPQIASDASGLGLVVGSGCAGFISNYQPTTIFQDQLLVTPQTIWWCTGSNTTGTQTSMYCSGYTI